VYIHRANNSAVDFAMDIFYLSIQSTPIKNNLLEKNSSVGPL